MTTLDTNFTDTNVIDTKRSDTDNVNLSAVAERFASLIANNAFASGDSLRIFHGRGNTYDGLHWLNIDFFHPVILVTLFAEIHDDVQARLFALITENLPDLACDCLVVQRRYLDKAPCDVIVGDLPNQAYAQRNGLRFFLSFEQQNVGFFLDIEIARQWVERECKEKNVLNLFSYTCAFSVVAKAAGAEHVVNMDMSSRALSIGRENHKVNGLSTDNVRFYAYDIFKSWGRIKRHGPYDLIIIDPPSFQKGSFVASKDYQRVIRKMSGLLNDDGCFLACLNAPEVDLSDFKRLLEAEADGFVVENILEASPYFPDISAEKRLKMLVFRKGEPKA